MNNCTWIGEGEGCTNKKLPNRNYCEDHIWKIYHQGTELVKRKTNNKSVPSVYFWEILFYQAVEELESEGWNPEDYTF